MIAALPMYDWPEVQAEVDAFYHALRARVPALPPALTRGADAAALWHNPALAFAQTCWGPLRAGLQSFVQVLAQPDYSDVVGGAGPLYRSAVVARAGRALMVPTTGAALPALSGRFAYNERGSLSGWIALAEDAGDPATWATGLLETGSHRASIRAVAEGRADTAAIDCRSWALALAHEPCARGLVVIGWTAERLGLPFITSRTKDTEFAAALQAALIDMGAHAPLAKDETQ